MRVDNNTPFPALSWISIDNNDQKYITSLVRVKYKFDTLDDNGIWSLKFDTDQEDFFSVDIFYNEEKKIVQYEADYIPFKVQGDLIVNMSNHGTSYDRYKLEVLRYKPVPDTKEYLTTSLLKRTSADKLGFVYRAHKSRMKWLGTLDQKWIDTRAPKYPLDFNEQYFNAAHPKLQLFRTYFKPGDAIVFHKFLPGMHQQVVHIPGVFLTSSVHEGEKSYPTYLEADTVIFDIEHLDMRKNNIYISYRNRVKYDKDFENLSFDMKLNKEFIERRSA